MADEFGAYCDGTGHDTRALEHVVQLLETADHMFLEFHACRLFVQEPFSQVVAIELSEHVFVRKVHKKIHHGLEAFLHRSLSQLLSRLVPLQD